MKLSTFVFAGMALLCSLLTNRVNATVYADSVYAFGPCSPVVPLLCPSGVNNPSFAVDQTPNNYTLLNTTIGLGASAYYHVGFPVSAPGGSVVSFVIQPENNVLNLNLLQTITVYLYNGAGTLVGTYNNFSTADLDLLSGNGQQYILNVYSVVGSYQIKSARIEIGGLLQLANTMRVYSAFYNVSCPPIYANAVHSQSVNQVLCLTGCVYNAGDMVDGNPTTFATFGTLISLANMFIEVSFPVPADSNDFIGFTLGDSPALLSLNLLTNMSAAFLDINGNTVFSISDFSLADVFLIDPGSQTYGLGGKVPNTVTVPIHRARISYNGVGVLYSIKIYNAFHYKIKPPVAIIAASNQVVCHGGQVTLSSADTVSVAWQWQPSGALTQSISVNQPGTYTLTITDIDGCKNSDTITLIQRTPLWAVNDSMRMPECYGLNTGYAGFHATGGNPDYQYSWSHNPGLNDSIASNLTAGVYTVIVTDEDGCTDTSSFNITEPDSLIAINTFHSNPLCFGDTTGISIVHTEGGTGSYMYGWNHVGALNDSIATGLGAGTYTVTVTDINGCSDTAIFTITQPDSLVAVTSLIQPPECFGYQTGSSVIHTEGGTTAYTYQWSHNNGLNDSIATGLGAGTYTVTVTDINGCTDTAIVQVNHPGLLSTNAEIQDLYCYQDGTGSFIIIPSGGTPGIHYEVNGNIVGTGINWGDTIALTGLSAGTYYLVLSDSNGCETYDTLQVTEPDLLAATLVDFSNADCNVLNGAATIVTTGGTPAYTYVWSHDPNITGDSATNLPAGSATVIIYDLYHCADTVSINLQSINAPVALLGTDSVLCRAGISGTAFIDSITGNGGYTYVWFDQSQNPINQTGPVASGLPAGMYIVEITDQNGCVVSDSIMVNEPSTSVSVAITESVNPLCFGSADGFIVAAGANGTGGIQYSWLPGNIPGDSLTGVGAGTYIVTAQDANGCTAVDSILIGQPEALSMIPEVNPAACFGAGNGSISLTISGGTPAYHAIWPELAATGNMVTDLSAGNYTVNVTDNNGCEDSLTITVSQPELLVVSLQDTVVPICGKNNGAIYIDVTGGTMNYTYAWSNGAQNQDLTEIFNGSYNVIVTDANGCKDSLFLTLGCEIPFVIPQLITPNGNGKNDTWYIPGLDKFPGAGVEIFNRWGNTVFSETPYQNNWDGVSTGMATIGNGRLPSGTYFYVLDLGNGTEKLTGYIELQH